MSNAKSKYQIFISSTYEDLQPERRALVWATLKMEHIPIGMESISARPDRGWKTIRALIDDTDYYVLVIAGRYGSVEKKTGISWTEKEYDYAVSKGIPVLAFLKEDQSIPSSETDRDTKKQGKLKKLKQKVRGRHHVRTWNTGTELESEFKSALATLIREQEGTSEERPGWIRRQAPISREIEPSRSVPEKSPMRTQREATEILILDHNHIPVSNSVVTRPKFVLSVEDASQVETDGDDPERVLVRNPGMHWFFKSDPEKFRQRHFARMKEYVDYLNTVFFFEIGLKNETDSLYEDVTFELFFDEVVEVTTKFRDRLFGIEQLSSPSAITKVNNVFLNLVREENGLGRISFGIGNLIPGRVERIPAFCVLPVLDGESLAFETHFKIKRKRKPISTGKWTITYDYNEEISLSQIQVEDMETPIVSFR